MTNDSTNGQHDITAREAGRRGGEATRATHDADFYRRNGRKGGRRVQELTDLGHQVEGR